MRAALGIAGYDLRRSLLVVPKLVGLLLTPCMTLVILFTVTSQFSNNAGNRILYIYPGVLAITCMSAFPAMMGKPAEDRKSGILRNVLLSSSGVHSLTVGHLMAVIVQAAVQASAMLAVADALIDGPCVVHAAGALAIISTVVAGALVFGMLGLACGCMVRNTAIMQIPVMLLMMFGAIGSTAYWKEEQIPGMLNTCSRFNPVTFLSEAMRMYTPLGSGNGMFYGNYGYILVFGGIGFLMLVVGARSLEKKVV